jgi:hypothetical protein
VRLLPGLAAAAGLALAGPLSGATLDARSIVYLPSLCAPGEELSVQALILPDGKERLEELDLKPGSGLPEDAVEADPELRELRLSKTPSGWLLSLRFVPWSPGPLSLPAMRLRGMLIPAVPYSAASVLGPEDREPSPPRRQCDPPGTVLFLYGLAGLLLALALGAAGTAAYLVPAARALLARRRAAQAFGRFAKGLDYLAAEAGSAEPSAFFAALSRAFRLYLASRALPSAPVLTASELSVLPESAFPAPATKDKAARFLAYADKVRYGGEMPGRAALVSAVDEARAIGEANEEAILARL